MTGALLHSRSPPHAPRGRCVRPVILGSWYRRNPPTATAGQESCSDHPWHHPAYHRLHREDRHPLDDRDHHPGDRPHPDASRRDRTWHRGPTTLLVTQPPWPS